MSCLCSRATRSGACRWYTFQFLAEELVDAFEELQDSVSALLIKLPSRREQLAPRQESEPLL